MIHLINKKNNSSSVIPSIEKELLSDGSKTLTLCADDYAQNKEISEGIILLASKHRINATSCMVNSPVWSDAASALIPLNDSIKTGLHFNLTHGNAISSSWKKTYGAAFPSMLTVLQKSFLQGLDAKVVKDEFCAQFDCFTQTMNRYPDFIDGHQHVHQLPTIRQVFLQACAETRVPISIRKTTTKWRDLVLTDGFPKRQLLGLLGGLAFNQDLKSYSFPTNTSFSGMYDFKKATHYRDYFKGFLKQSQHNGLIMCHPGNVSTDISDPLHLYRHYERDYLLSDEYLIDLEQYGFALK